MISEKLLQAAVEHFASHGFEGASTREIARSSGTAMSSITYHFGGKEGLYLAAAGYIAQCINDQQAARLEALRADPPSTPDAARQALADLLAGLAKMMLDQKSAAWAQFIVREQQYPTAAFERLFDGAMYGVASTCEMLVRMAQPDLGKRETRATVALLFGQLLILRTGRATICRLMEVETLGEAEETILLDRLRAHVNAIMSEALK